VGAENTSADFVSAIDHNLNLHRLNPI